MIAKDYLRRLNLLSARIEMRQDELAELENRLEELETDQYSLGSTDYSMDRVQTSGPTSQVENAVIRTQITREKIIDLKNKLNEMISEYLEEKHEIIKSIEQLQDDRFIKILNLRYIKNMSFNEIILNDNENWWYGQSQTFRLHGLALAALQKIIDEREIA